MDKSTLYGLVLAFTLVLGSIAMRGSFMVFLSLSSAILVLGGVYASTVISYSFEDVHNTMSLLSATLKETDNDLRTDIELMNMFARKSRREGLLAMEEDIENIDEPFLRSGLKHVLDGIEEDTLQNILSDRLANAEHRLNIGVKVLNGMAEYSPSYGMIGTLVGLIFMLQNMQDPESLGAGLAVALLTTLYGSMLANMIFMPLGMKLSYMGDEQLIRKQMFQAAILSIINKENPRIMENKMLNYVSPADRAEYLAYYEVETFDKNRAEKIYANWEQFQFESWQNLTLALERG